MSETSMALDTAAWAEYVGKLPNDHGGHSYFARGLYAWQLERW
jgi:hypothetical protein